ncbi:hypothetical protein AX16_008669 [Volvariella volvacea WC 439]|nr:hypothetical protein AX16_008669 [Volvariella volvacea WC 439]
MATSQAAENNNKLFPLYRQKLSRNDLPTYENFAGKLALWLSEDRAYYTEARPEVVFPFLVSAYYSNANSDCHFTHAQVKHLLSSIVTPAGGTELARNGTTSLINTATQAESVTLTGAPTAHPTQEQPTNFGASSSNSQGLPPPTSLTHNPPAPPRKRKRKTNLSQLVELDLSELRRSKQISGSEHPTVIDLTTSPTEQQTHGPPIQEASFPQPSDVNLAKVGERLTVNGSADTSIPDQERNEEAQELRSSRINVQDKVQEQGIGSPHRSAELTEVVMGNVDEVMSNQITSDHTTEHVILIGATEAAVPSTSQASQPQTEITDRVLPRGNINTESQNGSTTYLVGTPLISAPVSAPSDQVTEDAMMVDASGSSAIPRNAGAYAGSSPSTSSIRADMQSVMGATNSAATFEVGSAPSPGAATKYQAATVNSTRRMRILGLQRGLQANSTIRIDFVLPQKQIAAVKAWVDHKGTYSPNTSYLCVSLGCYHVGDMEYHFSEDDDATVIEEQFSKLKSMWPKHGKLHVKIHRDGTQTVLPLSPPFSVNDDGLVDISRYLSSGSNTLELIQKCTMLKHVFVLYVHRPTETQEAQQVNRREKEQQWKSWLTRVSTLNLPNHDTRLYA